MTRLKEVKAGVAVRGLAQGQWTGRASIGLCLPERLIEKRAFDSTDQLEKYLRWYREGHMSSAGTCFDIRRGATQEALDRMGY